MRDAGGRFCSGIHTIDDLKKRCEIDEDTGCWTYQGAKKPWAMELGRAVHLTTLMGRLIEGDWPKPGRFWYPTCGNDRCCNPEHRKVGTWSTVMKNAVPKRTAELKAKVSMTKRRKSKITEEMVQEIRASTDTEKNLGKAYGISRSTAGKIRRSDTRADGLNGASVFTWRP